MEAEEIEIKDEDIEILTTGRTPIYYKYKGKTRAMWVPIEATEKEIRELVKERIKKKIMSERRRKEIRTRWLREYFKEREARDQWKRS